MTDEHSDMPSNPGGEAAINPQCGHGAPHPYKMCIDGRRITLDELDDALGRTIELELSDSIWARVERSAKTVERIAAQDAPFYGVNTGFGSLCSKRISLQRLGELQLNLILSHAGGVGEPVAPEIVRWMMAFKVLALTHGVSGVSRPTLECLIQLINHDVLPVIPSQGSLGASGDLAPLAHMVLPMIGLGKVCVGDERMPALRAMQRFGIKPIKLGPKEGLGLINGTQFMAAHAVSIAIRSQRLAKHADVVACMSLEGFKGSTQPFDEALHSYRPHAGAVATASNIRRMMVQSEILESHADCQRVQDPYSFRCVPQVHGAARDALAHASGVIETEINSVTDNPLILDDDRVVSGGLFHGQPLAMVLDYLAMALAELASISERRIYQLLSGTAELPTLLMHNTGINSGFMLAQYTAAALVSENKGLCMPACVDSIPTSLGQEDHVSMGARSAVKCQQILVNTETVLAIEQMCAAQAIDFRLPNRPGVGPRTAHAEVRKTISHTEKDRLLADDIQKSLALLRTQALVQSVENVIGKLDP